ncbi:type II secretion system F family protein [Salinicola endophyticus]|uniref:Type II secretion system F family protein n=1 Tax=Salinicola endophyticus TaxID=1949083 RepID=A0AB74UFU3_9GAMM
MIGLLFNDAHRIRLSFAKVWIDARKRSDFYASLRLLLKNGVSLRDALTAMLSVYSAEGRHPWRPMALMTEDLLSRVADEGLTLSRGVSSWAPPSEALALSAGEQGNDLSGALERCRELIRVQGTIKKTLLSAAVGPLLQLLGMGVAAYVFSTRLVPALLSRLDPSQLSLSNRLIRNGADVVANFWPLLLIGSVVSVLAILLSIPHWHGRSRLWVERIPPWSIYREVVGSSFLIDIAVLIGSGMQIRIALQRMSEFASPYLRERIDMTLDYVMTGSDLGKALHQSRLNFPSREGVEALRLLASLSGFEKTLGEFGRDWLERSVERVKRQAAIFNFGMLILNATMILGMAGAMASMQMSFMKTG